MQDCLELLSCSLLSRNMTNLQSISFGALEQGIQVGQSYGGSITAEFHLPPGEVTGASCERISPANIGLERPETPPAPFSTIPFSHDPDFVNREDILDQIEKRCSEEAARVALVGLGGVGYEILSPDVSGKG